MGEDGQREYTRAQQDALELLSYFDRLCEINDVEYTIKGKAISCIRHGHKFGKISPNSIEVCLKYEDFSKICEVLQVRATDDGYVFVDGAETEHFDTYACRLAKPNHVFLPENRKADEIYYYTFITIALIHYAGDTLAEVEQYRAQLSLYNKLLNARMPLPQKRTFSDVRAKLARRRARHYVKQREEMNFTKQDLLDFINDHSRPTKYVIIGNMTLETEELRWLTVDFYGVSVKVLANYGGIVSQVSDLLLRGGEDLRRVQLIQLDLLKEFDRICRKHNLKYNIAFGTLLGAVRHKGFVPWDDDVDVNMLVDDYLKFQEIVKTELDTEKYYFRNQSVEEDCNITYAHLKRNGTVYTKFGREAFRYHPGVFLDIVPLFNGAPCFPLHWLHTRICWFFRTACWAYVGADSEKRPFKRWIYKQMAKIGNKRAFALFWYFATFFKKKSNKLAFFNGLDRSPYNVGFVRRDGFEKAVEYEFEGEKFFGPSNVQEVLEYCYGKDYAMYPPLGARKPKNKVIIKLGGLYAYDDELKVGD